MNSQSNRVVFSKGILKATTCIFLTAGISIPSVFALPVESRLQKIEMVQQDAVTISGKVIDQQGEPVIGANVTEKGTTNGTITDISGLFKLNVKNKSKLQVSFIGYITQEILVGGQKTLTVTLIEDTQKIDEVIVTAFGTSKKSSFTGSASVVSADKLEKVAASNISQGLQGLSAGVQVVNSSGRPGDDATIVIRGLGSMTAKSDPLYVIDGVPSDAPLNVYSSSDIESITVLKDAASTSLYGSRAGNGVVLITTKKGKQGKTKVNLRANWGTSEFAVKFPEKVSPGKQYELAFEGLYNDATDFLGYNDAAARQYAHDKVTSVFWKETPLTLNDGTVRKYRSGWNMDNPIGLDGKLKSDAKRLWEFDAFDEAFSHRLKQDYGADISGAMGDKNTYFVSFSMLDDKGVHMSDHFRRFTGRAVLETKINKFVEMSNTMMYTSSKNTNGGFATRVFRVMPSNYSAYLWDHNTNSYAISPYTGNKQLDEGRNNGRNWWGNWSSFGCLSETVNNHTDNVQTISALTINLLKGLKLRSTYSYQYNNSFDQNWKNPEREDVLVLEEGTVGRAEYRATSHNVNNVLTYDKTISDVHHINVMIGQEIYKYNIKSFGVSRTGLPLPFFTQITSATKDPTAWSTEDTYSLASFFAKADYDLSSKYYISASIRTDGSSRFHPDNRWGKFWSIGGSWRISQENFMESTNAWLNNLKMKVSYGEVGNDNVVDSDGLNEYYVYQGLYAANNNYAGNMGVIQSQLANNNVKWETNIQSNVGLEFTLFSKFSGSIEWFSRKSKNLLLGAPLAPSTGMNSILKNIGDIKNVGWEFDFNYQAFQSKKFDWNIGLNATTYKNTITSLPSKEETFNAGVGVFKWKEGGSRYDIYMPEFAGVNPDNGRNQWFKREFDANGNVTNIVKTENYSEVDNDKQRVNKGSVLPDVYGSLTNSFRYKNIDLSFMLYYSIGGQTYDYNYGESSVLRENFAAYGELDNRWKKPGDITNIAKIYTYKCFDAYSNAKYSDQYLFSNSFLRLKNLTLGYTIPKSIISKLGIETLRVYFRGDNLFTVSKLASHGSDPENGTLDGVIDGEATIPALRSYNLGVNISF